MKKLWIMIVAFLVLFSACRNPNTKSATMETKAPQTASTSVPTQKKQTSQKTSVPKTTTVPTEKKETKPTEAPAETKANQENTKKNDIRPEFQEAMDAYLEFFDEYVEIMQEYQKNSTDMSLALKSMSYLARYEETMEKLDAISEADLTDAELALYLDTMNTINQKLLKVIN